MVTRARTIVRIAADQKGAAEEWLRRDERGVFEAMALSFLQETKEKAEELRMTPSEVNEEIATAIRFIALKTMSARKAE